MCTAIHSERKSRAFQICNLVFGKSGNPQIVCDAANLQGGVESIHNLQNAVHYQIPRRFSLIKRAWIRIVTASSSSFKYWQQKCISACRFHYSFFRKGYSYPFPQIHSLTHMMNGDNNQPIHRPFYTHGYCAAVLPCDKATFGQKEAIPQREQLRRADRPSKFFIDVNLSMADYPINILYTCTQEIIIPQDRPSVPIPQTDTFVNRTGMHRNQ